MQKLKIILQSNIILIVLIIVIIFSLIKNNREYVSCLDESTTELIGEVIEAEKSEDKLRLIVKSKEKILVNYYTDKDFNICLGDIVKLNGQLEKPLNNTIPNTFNYKEYLENKEIFYIMNAESLEIIKRTDNIFYKIKNALIKRIEKYEISDYLNTFILGNKDYLNEEVYESYQNNGVVHLFCISGTHISLLVSVVLFIFEKIKLSIKLSYFIVFILLIFYMFLTDFGASVLRSGVFFILLGLKRIDYLKLNTKNIFYLTIIILLLINSNLLYDIGFLYSASITYGLLISKRLIKGNYINKVFIISLISTIVSLPITINNFYEVNLMGIIYNIFFVPIVSFIITPLSFIVLLFPFFEMFLDFLINILEFVSLSLNFVQFNLVVPKLNIFFIIVYYLLVYLFLKQKNRYLIYIVILVLFIKVLPILNNNYYVYFLDVGQGDSTLIKYRNEVILIDTGGIVSFSGSNYKVSDKTISLIKSLGFSSVDYLILTHGDYDHAGDAVNIIENLKVKNVIFNEGNYNELEKEILKYAKNVESDYNGSLNLKLLKTKNFSDENSDSIVTYLNINSIQFLLMGDATIASEEVLLNKYNLDIDILKVGHHGSDTSSGDLFLKIITPKIAIISSGRNNRYNHPSGEVVSRLEENKIKYYNTQNYGSIMFKINKNKLEIETYIP